MPVACSHGEWGEGGYMAAPGERPQLQALESPWPWLPGHKEVANRSCLYC